MTPFLPVRYGQFVMDNSFCMGDKALLLHTFFFTEKFKEASELFCDGTFLYTPNIPNVNQRNVQIYRIFGLVMDTVIVPCFTIIMTGKSADDYRQVFGAISRNFLRQKQQSQSFSPWLFYP
uniref:MULE transposase domain-containing protein n=1 Tax=Panagrolaimus davidi TaxID=227884 RepID=A0A914PKW5_9BILA